MKTRKSRRPLIQKPSATRTSRLPTTTARRSREVLSEILDFVRDGVIVIDKAERILVFNREAERLFGYLRSDLIGKPLSRLVTARSSEFDEALKGRAREKNLASDKGLRLSFRRSDGSEFTAVLSVFRYADRETIRCAVVREAKTLQEGNDVGSGLVNHGGATEEAYDWEFWLAPDGRYAYVAPSCEQITGYSCEEFVREPGLLKSIVVPEDRRVFEEHQHRVCSNAAVGELSFRVATRWGETRWIHHVCQPVFASDGRYLGHRASQRDITARKEAEIALRQSEEQYRILAETTRDMVVLYDLDGRVLYANPATERLLGVAVPQNRREYIRSWIAPEYLAAAEERREKRVRGDYSVQQYEVELIGRDGERIPLEVTSAVTTTTGSPLVVSIARDIRERKKAEADLRQQLSYARALNRISEVIMSGETQRQAVLDTMVKVIGETLAVERCLIFEINHAAGDVHSLSKWMGPGIADFAPGRETYSVETFRLSGEVLFGQRTLIASHADDRHPVLEQEGSASILHDRMGVRSLLWYPFGFHEDGHYLLVFNQMTSTRSWRNEEIEFVDSVSKHVDIALMKMRLVREREEAEESVRQAEARFREIFENVVEGVYQTTLDGRFIVVNPAMARILGYRTPDELVESVEDIESQLYLLRERRPELSRQLLEHGRVQDFESEVYRKDGRRIWVSENVRLVRNPTGTPAYFEGTLVDITDRKVVEKRLIQTLQEFETLTEGIPDAVFFKDGEGRWLITNAPAKKLFQLATVDWQGKTDRELAVLQPSLQKAYEACIASDEAAWRNGRKTVGLEIVQDDEGSNHYFETTKIPLFDEAGGRLGLVVIGHDVTLDRQAHEIISEQALILDNARDSILLTDLNHRVLYCNRSAEKLYGWSRTDIVGRSYHDLIARQGKDSLDMSAQVRAHGHWAGEIRHYHQDGRELIVESRQSLINDSEGHPKSVLMINTDVTEKKRTEREFLRTQRMESIGRMAGGIAHDLNNILSPILMAVQIFKDKIEDESLLRLIPMLESNVQRGADLMKKLLMFTRGVEGEHVKVDIRPIVNDVRAMVEAAFPKNVQLLCDVRRDVWPLRGDATQLHQILLNLCVNARDAMPDGGTLSILVVNVWVLESEASGHPGARAGPHVLLSISDTGEGIPADILDRIFEPFFSTKDVDAGTGLGLSTVAAIVRGHGGYVNVSSEVGRGTTFKVYLPADRSEANSRHEHPVGDRWKGRGECVLVVDDEVSVRSVLAAVLEANGYRVLQASNGEEALSLIEKNRPDIRVVVSDMSMPRMDGPAFVRRLRSLQRNVQIIGMSGLPTDAARTRGEEIDRFLQKPYHGEDILQALHELLSSDAKGDRHLHT